MERRNLVLVAWTQKYFFCHISDFNAFNIWISTFGVLTHSYLNQYRFFVYRKLFFEDLSVFNHVMFLGFARTHISFCRLI